MLTYLQYFVFCPSRYTVLFISISVLFIFNSICSYLFNFVHIYISITQFISICLYHHIYKYFRMCIYIYIYIYIPGLLA